MLSLGHLHDAVIQSEKISHLINVSIPMMNFSTPADFINLKKYPIDDLESAAGIALLAQCHKSIAQHSILALPGFLRSGVTTALTEEINGLHSVARKIDFLTTLYGWMDNSGFPPTHPRSTLLRRHCGVITTDQLDPDGLCMRLFHIGLLTEFVRRLLQYETLYASTCPNISVRLNIMEKGDEFPWHFDTNDGVVSFIIQNADEGGHFQHAPSIRSEENEIIRV